MDIYNFGSALVTAITAIVMVIASNWGISMSSPEAIVLFGTSLVISSIVLELFRYRPRFLFIPVWLWGIAVLGYGFYTLQGWVLLILMAPILFLCLSILKKSQLEHIHKMMEVSHKYTDGDPEKLRDEIQENRERREQARKSR